MVYQDIEGNYERKLLSGSFSLPSREWDKDVYSSGSSSPKLVDFLKTYKTFRCEVCGQVFVNQNQFFKHQKDKNHFNKSEGSVSQPVPNIFSQPSIPSASLFSFQSEEKKEEKESIYDDEEDGEELGLQSTPSNSLQLSQTLSLNQGVEFFSLCNVPRGKWNE